ncbi:MAG: DNA repair protein RecN [Alphaproteobacteria bacterium]|jgi:DNA repair protein RecN (Recombination protein N)
MLTNLYISNIVLIDKLNLEFGRGLNVLTGETGAGKSILLDALALSLGARSDIGLIRHGCDNAQVIAEFNYPNKLNTLTEHGIESDGTIILRRTLSTDGKSRAWINDTPVTIKVLKQVGDELCEIHGQFENHSLLDPATHITTLDEFGGYDLSYLKNAYNAMHSAEKDLKELQELLDRNTSEREFLEHNIKELSALNPISGEEEELATRRSQLMDAEKNSAILNDANTAIQGLDEKIFNVAHILERIKTNPNPYSSQIDLLYNSAEIIADIESKISPIETDTETLENIESRLFAIRAIARKHKVIADQLPEKLQEMINQLNTIDNSEIELKRAETIVKQKTAEYEKIAKQITMERIAASIKLRDAIVNEFPDLKLAQADFKVEITKTTPTVNGNDEVIFMIKTNPGTPFAPLHKIASGGELARLMLALRVVLINNSGAKIFVFDEVDTGISGATASAVGARLSRLAQNGQALVVTHSAQVAGFADSHFLIQKKSTTDSTITSVHKIENNDRINEIARIISGDKITQESIATARTLIK